MKDRKDIDPREALRLLTELRDEEPESERAAWAGIDMVAFTEYVLATIAAYEAGRLTAAQALRSAVPVRRARAPAMRRRIRR
jgi:hypothetical protein